MVSGNANLVCRLLLGVLVERRPLARLVTAILSQPQIRFLTERLSLGHAEGGKSSSYILGYMYRLTGCASF